jgi:hypothetical protein
MTQKQGIRGSLTVFDLQRSPKLPQLLIELENAVPMFALTVLSRFEVCHDPEQILRRSELTVESYFLGRQQ